MFSKYYEYSAIMRDEVIVSFVKSKGRRGKTTFNEKNLTCKRQTFYILLAFLIYYSCDIDSC